ncbi:unnamed protein product [Colias eurytheme]|nr:unnamed protein product [Colias eurytheme]
MQSLMNEENQLHWFLNSGDVFIVDRGFRDSIVVIQSCGYEVHMPPTKDRTASQLKTEQANKSRLVTICRWDVEAVNGKFKNRFRLLRQTYFNRALSHMFCDFKIAAAIINAYYRVAVDNRFAAEIVNIIHSRMNMSNHLHDYVHMKNLNRQTEVSPNIRHQTNNMLMHYGLTIIQERKLAYEYARVNQLRYPPSWNQNKMAGKEWLDIYRRRAVNF